MHMVTETYQLRDGDKLTEFYNGIDWKPLFEFVRRYYGIGVEQPPITCLKPNGHIEVNWPENLRDKCGLFGHTYRDRGRDGGIISMSALRYERSQHRIFTGGRTSLSGLRRQG